MRRLVFALAMSSLLLGGGAGPVAARLFPGGNDGLPVIGIGANRQKLPIIGDLAEKQA